MTSLAEKAVPGGTLEEGIKRALLEELDLTSGYIIIKLCTRVEEKYSKTYPGLLTRYIIHDVLVDWDGDSYETSSHTEYRGDTPRLTATWEWISRSEVTDDWYNKTLESLGL